MLLSIIIVNYKTPYLVLSCIESVLTSISNSFDFEIIIIDNHSEDNSELIVKSVYSNIIWINSTSNIGFGRGNNIGIKQSKGEYVLLINSDVIVKKETIIACLNKIQSNHKIGLLSCAILNEDGSKQKFTSHVASYRKILDRNILFNYFIKPSTGRIEAIMGSFMFIPVRVIEKCGMFDPDFFMYSEEIELCHRINKGGFEIIILDDVEIIHKNGGSTSDRTWAIRQSYLSEALLFYKVRGYSGYVLYQLLKSINYITNFFFMWFVGSDYRTHFFIDVKNFYCNIKNYLLIPVLYRKKIGSGKRLLKYI